MLNKRIIRSLRCVLAALTPAVIFMFWAPSSGYSQSTHPSSLNLESAVEQALEKNPQTKINDSQITIAEAKVEEAKTGKKPTVQFSQSAIRSNNPVFVFGSLLEQGRFGETNFAVDSLNHPSGLFNFRTKVEAQMPIFDQNQTRSRVTRAEIEKTQTELQGDFVRQQLRFQIIRIYYSAVLEKEMLKVNVEAVKSAEANRKKANDLAEVGMTTGADFLAAEVELANAKQQTLESESNLITTMAELNLAIGGDPDIQRDLSGTLQERYFPLLDRTDLTRLALENRPDFQMAEMDVQNSRERTGMIENQKLPRVDAFANFGYSSPYAIDGSSDYTIGVELTYTLFDAGRKARIKQAAEGETHAGLKKEQLSNQIRLEVIRSLQSYKTSRAKIMVSIKSIAHAEEALRIIQDRYTFGFATFNEVLSAESRLVRAKHDLLISRYQYYLSYASVLLSTGRMSGVAAFK